MKNTEVAPTPASHNASPDLRSWLRRLAATGRLAVTRNGVSLIDELAAVSKKLELERAVMFPRPGGHPMTVVANLLSIEAGSRIRSACRPKICWRGSSKPFDGRYLGSK